MNRMVFLNCPLSTSESGEEHQYVLRCISEKLLLLAEWLSVLLCIPCQSVNMLVCLADFGRFFYFCTLLVSYAGRIPAEGLSVFVV